MDFFASLMMQTLKVTSAKREIKDVEWGFQKGLGPIFRSDGNWVVVPDQ